MILAVDIDGVLANFDYGFRNKLAQVTGKTLIPMDDDWQPPCWDYPQHYGYSNAEVSKAWNSLKNDGGFWRTLRPYPSARGFLDFLWRKQGDVNWSSITKQTNPESFEVYFITARAGRAVQRQTEIFLHANEFIVNPTVLIARGDKGPMLKSLGVTHFIDDRPENIESALTHAPGISAYLLSRPWNVHRHDDLTASGAYVMPSLTSFQHLIERTELV